MAGRDCYGAIAKDLVFSIADDPTLPVAHFGTLALQGTASPETPSGYAAQIANVPEGFPMIEARQDGELVARKQVVVRADWVTFVNWMYPSP